MPILKDKDEEKSMKTLGLALGAGGSRGVAHIGFLKALEEAGVKPENVLKW